jgi:hypothetical protein
MSISRGTGGGVEGRSASAESRVCWAGGFTDLGSATLVSTVTVMLLDTLGKDAVCETLTAVIRGQTAVSGTRPSGTRRFEELSTVGRMARVPMVSVTLAGPRSAAMFWRTKEKVVMVCAGMATVGTAVRVPASWSQVPAVGGE